MTDAELQRQIEAELDQANWRSLRPMLLAAVLMVVIYMAYFATTEAATL